MKDYVFSNTEDTSELDWMPTADPLDMPTQDFSRSFTDPKAPAQPAQRSIWIRRALILLPALGITSLLSAEFISTLPAGGNVFAQSFWVAMTSLMFFWISFVLCLSASGGVAMWKARRKPVVKPKVTPPLDVAILMPVYNEDVAEVFSNVLAMHDDLRASRSQHKFSVYILSDSQDPKVIAQEQRAFVYLQANKHPDARFFYRRRSENTDYKTGNLRQWISNYGGAHDAMLVLDADSLMSFHAVLRLTDTLAQNPHLGLVQGALRIFRGRRLVARWQQFVGPAFGALHAHGLAFWSGNEGNFFGHNAICRTRAFATCSGLPSMPSRNRHIPIFSHDFVEAALMRRAGWGIKILPDLEESFEGTPETLIDFIKRDRRWCQGNMQHLRIMTSKGFHPISRFHMLHNALTYLMSPAWLALMVMWTTLGLQNKPAPGHSVLIFAAVYGLLTAPKIAGAVMVLASRDKRRSFGGTLNFLRSFLFELASSILLAPILMVHQTVSVIRSIFRLPPQWGTPVRQGSKQSLSVLLRFHAIETSVGGLLTILAMAGQMSVWILPISVTLALAPVISFISALDLRADEKKTPLLQTAIDKQDPEIMQMGDEHYNTYRKLLSTQVQKKERAVTPSYRPSDIIQKSA